MTEPFREVTPQRRENRSECKNYSSYRKTLSEDFLSRCGYCNDYDRYNMQSFSIDHFVPKNPRGFTHNIPPNNYYNLVWSCPHCNSAKSDKWPTKNSLVHNNGMIGFVDPVTNGYGDLFIRDSNGCIIPDKDNDLAKYIVDELKLWLPIHSLMWRLEKLKNIELELKDKEREVDSEELRNEINQIGGQISSIMDDVFDQYDK